MTTWIGAALNLAAAAGAVWLVRRGAAASAPEGVPPSTHRRPVRRQAPRPAAAGPPAVRPQPLVAAAVAALSGCAALVYEVAWTRILALVIGPTTYAFATMVAAFVTGIAIGSAAGARLVRSASRPVLWLAASLVVTAVGAAAAAAFAGSRLPLVLAAQVGSGADFDVILPRQAFAVFVLLLPASIGLGATFSFALAAAASGREHVGRDAARVYAANTVGAIGGALACGFVLIPLLGLHGTVMTTSRALAVAGLLIAAFTWWRDAPPSPGRRAAASAAVAAALLCGVIALPPWDRDLLSSGAYKYARYVGADTFAATLRAGTLEYYREGAAGTVSVRRTTGTRALAIDGKVDASDAEDMLTQRLLGALPVLLHPDPREVLVIGLGSGVTAAAALAAAPLPRADVVEISPEVVEASAFFAAENAGVRQAPAMRLIVGDGRSHLLLARRRYDVIVSEPSNPWMAGVAALFTREFFAAAHARLEPDGVLCQWAHTYEMSAADLKSIVASFASVFPNGTMWLVGDGDLLLIGSRGPGIESRLDRLATLGHAGVPPAVMAGMSAPPSAAPFILLSLFAGGPAHLAAYSGGAPLQVDDRMALEFSAPRAAYAATRTENAADIRALAAAAPLPALVTAALENADAEQWAARGDVAMRAGAHGMALDSYRRAVALDARNAGALRGLSRAAAPQAQTEAVRQSLETLARQQPFNAAVRVELSYVAAAAGRLQDAVAHARDAIGLAPDDPRALEQLASVLADAGDAERLTAVADDLLSRFPDRAESRYYAAVSLMLRGRPADAAGQIRRVLAVAPDHAKGQNLLGVACAAARDLACARAAFVRSIEIDARDPAPYVNLGVLHLESGDAPLAASRFAEALSLDPASAAARDGLAAAEGRARASARRRGGA